jgi:hypothetical protein
MALMAWLSGFNSLESALEPGLRDSLTLLMGGLAS